MLNALFPFLKWFRRYGVEALRLDALSGLTVALVLIPQSMAYAQLAGLPAYYGLYASFLPPMIAALFGSSRQLATGPVAVVSLMTAASLGPLATAGSQGYVAYAILLALIVGFFQLSLGVLRLGLGCEFSCPTRWLMASRMRLLSSSHPPSFRSCSEFMWTALNTITRPSSLLSRKRFIIRIGPPSFSEHWPSPSCLLSSGYHPESLMFSSPVVVTTIISWAFGFEHDETVGVSCIKCWRAETLISEIQCDHGRVKGCFRKNAPK